MAKSTIAVFVSSTSEDLKDYRAVARNVILDLHWLPIMMEHFGAQPGATVDACRKLLDDCDVMLLIIAFRRGWVPPVERGGNGRDSITAFEVEHARRRGIPILALRADDNWPGKLWEDDASARQWVSQFREGIDLIAAPFAHETPASTEAARLPAFRALVKDTLVAQKERFLPRQESTGGLATGLDFFERARQGLVEGSAIPVVGCGIYGDGPLSSKALTSALLREIGHKNGASSEELSLATAAECRERFDGSRPDFLRHFRAALDEQAAAVSNVAALDMLAQADKVPVIVSTTYDRLLEERLVKAGRKHAVICHVLRSDEDKNDGKLLVVRPDAKPVICTTAEFVTEPGQCVVYKILGSPLLHDDVDPALELDTVVATETDCALFLQLLAKPDTGIPKSLTWRFRRSPLLFVGYTMHLWQYRLIVQVFQSAGRHGRDASTLAVRIPETAMEEVAWGRLKGDLVRMSPDEFAHRVAGPLAGSAGGAS
jgi:hypothetical protein